MTQKSIISLNNINTRYGKINAVNDICLEVGAGQIVTVIGANGAGKSTLLNSIMGSLPVNGTTKGVITYHDQDISQWSVERRVENGISLVPESRELFASMTVEDNLILGGFRLQRVGKPNWRDYVSEVYKIFPRLKERESQLAGTLSGGERQMLALGRALMAQPELLMLDEPSLGLAPRVVAEIFQIIARLRSTGVSILLVEQNARAALQVADYGYVLETGNMAFHGPATELSNDQRVIESYLGLGKNK